MRCPTVATLSGGGRHEAAAGPAGRGVAGGGGSNPAATGSPHEHQSDGDHPPGERRRHSRLGTLLTSPGSAGQLHLGLDTRHRREVGGKIVPTSDESRRLAISPTAYPGTAPSAPGDRQPTCILGARCSSSPPLWSRRLWPHAFGSGWPVGDHPLKAEWQTSAGSTHQSSSAPKPGGLEHPVDAAAQVLGGDGRAHLAGEDQVELVVPDVVPLTPCHFSLLGIPAPKPLDRPGAATA